MALRADAAKSRNRTLKLDPGEIRIIRKLESANRQLQFVDLCIRSDMLVNKWKYLVPGCREDATRYANIAMRLSGWRAVVAVATHQLQNRLIQFKITTINEYYQILKPEP